MSDRRADKVAARRRELDRHYGKRKRERPPISLAELRIRDLRQLYRHRFGIRLPDDEYGRDAAFVMACHLAKRPDAERRIGNYLELQCPWMHQDEAHSLIATVIAKQLRWRADKLALRLNLHQRERDGLKIRTIGAVDFDKANRIERRRQKARQRDRERRRRNGAKPRTEYEDYSISSTRPWEALGMSRRTWYRRGKPTDGTSPCAI
jgi:hypothetical protein